MKKKNDRSFGMALAFLIMGSLILSTGGHLARYPFQIPLLSGYFSIGASVYFFYLYFFNK
jgi:hypothetical protein